jgi:hypothetical protein
MDTSDTDSDDILKDVELQVLNEKIQGLSKNTISSYLRSYSQLRAALDKEVHLSSQKLIMETAQQLSNNLNTQAALINIGIIMRKLYALEVKELEMKRKQNKKGITQYTQEQNEKIGSTLPTLAEFDAHIDLLYSQNRFPEFLVNFLIRHLQVRNQDLVFELATKKADVKSGGKNYMHLGRGKALYYRRDYKTSKTYGEKIDEIKDKRFLTALRKASFPIISNPLQVGYYVKQMSFNQLGEGALVKIVVNHVREQGDFHALNEISKNRGTDVCTITTAYNVQPTKK